MIGRLLRRKETVPEEPYGLLPGHPQSSEEYVVEVTDYLNPKTRKFFSRRFRGGIYKVYLSLPPWGYSPLIDREKRFSQWCFTPLTDPEKPSVVALYPDGTFGHYYLTPDSPRPHIDIGFHFHSPLRSWKYLCYDYRLYETALHALMKGEVTESTRERIKKAFEKFMKEEGGEPNYRLPDKPPDQIYWPGNHYRLVNTVVNRLPLTHESELEEGEPCGVVMREYAVEFK